MPYLTRAQVKRKRAKELLREAQIKSAQQVSKYINKYRKENNSLPTIRKISQAFAFITSYGDIICRVKNIKRFLKENLDFNDVTVKDVNKILKSVKLVKDERIKDFTTYYYVDNK